MANERHVAARASCALEIAFGVQTDYSCYMENRHQFRTPHAARAYATSINLWDTPVYESESFIVLPTVGALVEGWLLVVPRKFRICIAQLTAAEFNELEGLLRDFLPVFEAAFGPASMFEHGPAEVCTTVGCGVDHAHLHIVPANDKYLPAARSIAANITWSSIPGLASIRRCTPAQNRQPYWFFQSRTDSAVAHLGTCSSGETPSQLFRRAIAAALGCPSEFDWKSNLGVDHIASTVEKLANVLTPA